MDIKEAIKNETPLDYIPMPAQFISEKEEDLFIMRIKGNGMYPTFEKEEMIVFKKCNLKDIKQDDVVLIKHKNQLKIKRFKQLTNCRLLVSDNKEEYNPIKVDKNINFIGKRIRLK
jgi:phage repressor protein C with HTH and peptisase S24 domain